MTIYIPIGDTNEAVEVAVNDLPDDEGEILGILQAELAPLDVWLHVAKAYLSKGKEEQFRNILEEATQPEIETYYPDSKCERTAILCTLASYHVNMGKAENDKIRRDDHFYKADGLLRAAELIKQKANGEEPEQAPVVGRAHLELAKGNLAAAEKLVDAARSLKDGGAGNVLPLLMKARLLYDRGQFAEALQWYRRALRSQGAAAPAGVRLGIGACQYQLGNFEGARLAFERTIQLEPTNVDALVGLASLADAKTNYVAAVKRGLELLERAFTLDPHHPGAQVELAKHFLYAGDDNLQAIEQLTETLIRGGADAIGSTPRLRAQAAMTRAKAHHSRGELQRAQGLYQAAAQMDETFHEPNFGLAQVALTRGDNKAALTYAERAYAAFPNSVEVQRVYGHCRRIADDAAAMNGGGGKAVEADPYDYDAQIEHGDALLAAREYEAALAAYEGAVEILNNGGKKADGTSTISSSLLNNVGVLKAMTKGAAGHEDTRAVFLAALEAAAKEEGGKGEKGEALDEPAERRKATGARLQVAFNLARLSEEKGDIEDATARYDDLLVASPEMTECLLRKAAMAAKRENFAAAEQFARKALETKPDDPDAMASVGHVLMKQSRWSEAQAQFKALRNLPKKLTPTQAALSAAAGKDPNAATHQHDEYAMLSLANAAYYQAVKLQSSVNHKRGDPKVREAEQAHLDYATTLYTKALQKNCSDMYAANGLGILLAEKGRIDEAKATFQMVAEGITAATGKGAEGAADSSLMSSPDIWINQGHVQMAKGNYVAAAK
ncbi:PAF1 complex protein Ctr9, partial [Micromonas pusilla CCMP1545]